MVNVHVNHDVGEEKWGVLIVCLLLFFVSVGVAQEKSDSTDVPITIEKLPGAAVLRSALLPGWGQLYNDQKLKALLVFTGEMALIGNAIYYNRLADKSQTNDEMLFYQDLSSQFLWWLFGVHLLNILDAYVDAHLWNFDTGPDLSLYPMHHGHREILLSLNFTF